MSLTTSTNAGFIRITELLKAVRDTAKSARGDLTALTTTEKSNLVLALNELKTLIDNKSSIDDTQSTTGNTWSASKISTEITTAINNLINGASADGDTLKELADRITSLAQADNGLVSATQNQSFTDTQKAQARDNIGVYSTADIGDITNADFVATINATYTA